MYRILVLILQGITGCFSTTTVPQGSFQKLCNNGLAPADSQTQNHRFNPAAILKFRCLSECLADSACSGTAVIQTTSSSGSCSPIVRGEKKTCSSYPADTAVTVYGNTVRHFSIQYLTSYYLIPNFLLFSIKLFIINYLILF